MVHPQGPPKTVHSTTMRTQFDTVEEKHEMLRRSQGGREDGEDRVENINEERRLE